MGSPPLDYERPGDNSRQQATTVSRNALIVVLATPIWIAAITYVALHGGGPFTPILALWSFFLLPLIGLGLSIFALLRSKPNAKALATAATFLATIEVLTVLLLTGLFILVGISSH